MPLDGGKIVLVIPNLENLLIFFGQQPVFGATSPNINTGLWRDALSLPSKIVVEKMLLRKRGCPF